MVATNNSFTEQLSLRWLLISKLVEYLYDNTSENCTCEDKNERYIIMYDSNNCHFFIGATCGFRQPLVVYFSNKEIAENAVKDIIEPFTAEHPEFRW